MILSCKKMFNDPRDKPEILCVWIKMMAGKNLKRLGNAAHGSPLQVNQPARKFSIQQSIRKLPGVPSSIGGLPNKIVLAT